MGEILAQLGGNFAERSAQVEIDLFTRRIIENKHGGGLIRVDVLSDRQGNLKVGPAGDARGSIECGACQRARRRMVLTGHGNNITRVKTRVNHTTVTYSQDMSRPNG